MNKQEVVFVVTSDADKAGQLIEIVRSDREIRVVHDQLPEELKPEETDAIIVDGKAFVEMQRSALTDPLTGLYNLRFFEDVLGREVARSERYRAPLSLLMIDVDGFKEVNDRFGHIAGNKALSAIAASILHSVRSTDFSCRCGGDEFAVILPETTGEGARLVADKIASSVASQPAVPTKDFFVTISVGVVEFRPGLSAEEFVAEADEAMYLAKNGREGRARAHSQG